MPAYFETSEIVKDKFIFVSYSHEDLTFFKECTEFLIDSGVRLWTDRAFCPEDKWEEEAKGLLRHENCCGVIWLCSEHSIKSKPVMTIELSTALKEQAKRSKEEYHIYIVSVCSDGKPNTYMQLLKKSFDLVDVNTADNDFDVDGLQTFIDMISGGTICVRSCDSDCNQKLLSTIEKRNKAVIDKGFILLEKLNKSSEKGPMVIDLGIQDKNGSKVPLKWKFLCYEGNEAHFISDEIIGVDYGGEYLEQWLNGYFKKTTFSDIDLQKITKPLRLFSKDEFNRNLINDVAMDYEWWLSDTRGKLQMIVRTDGTVYENGYNNKQYQKGVRPVITLDMEQLKEITAE